MSKCEELNEHKNQIDMYFDELDDLLSQRNLIQAVKLIQYIIWEPGNVARECDEPQLKKLVDYVIATAELGSEFAMNQLGAIYDEGIIVERDLKKSYEWYKKSAEKGYSLAISNLGFCYMYGKGINVDEKEAFVCFAKASALGELDATIRLGDMYMEGMFVEKDEKMAYKLYKNAYDISEQDLNSWAYQQSYSDACSRLGDIYYFGRSVMKNNLFAFKYYSKALYYYIERENKGDCYSKSGYEKTKEKLMMLLNQL